MPGTGRSRSGTKSGREAREDTAENGGSAAAGGEPNGLEDQVGGPLSGGGGDLPDRRRLRHEYRTLINETQKNRLDLIRPESKGLNDMLTKANGLFKSVKMTREAALDSQFLVLASTLGNQKANQLHTDFVTFEPHVFTDKLVSFMTGRRPIPEEPEEEEEEEEGRRRVAKVPAAGWEKLGNEARMYFNRAPAFHFLFGSFNREARAREGRRLSRRDANKAVGPKIVPKQVSQSDQTTKEATTQEVEFVNRALRQLTTDEAGNIDPIDYFEFVMDPDSFGRTIETIFYLSFLIKDGHARIYLDDNHLPVLVPADPYKAGESDEPVERKQVLISLTMEDWKRIKKEFEIKERAFPRRAEAEPPSGAQNGHTSSDDEGSPPRQKPKRRA